MTGPSPSYEYPPVSEVAIAAYFSPPLGLRSVHIGLLWERWRDRYPRTEDHPALPAVLAESFAPSPFPMPIQFGSPPGVRTWFLSSPGDRIVQLQADRLVLNWRRVDPEQPYPRYETIRPEFVQLLTELLELVKAEELGEVTLQQGEVMYINPIPVATVEQQGGLRGLLAAWTGENSDDFLPAPEDMTMSARFRIPHPTTNEPIGRLYFQLSRGMQAVEERAAVEDVYLLQLFARGLPLEPGMSGTTDFLDLGHDWVVRGFTSLTSQSMHELWGRRS